MKRIKLGDLRVWLRGVTDKPGLPEVGITAAIIRERFMFCNARRFDLAHDYRVITAGISLHNAAFYVGEGAIQKRRSAGAPSVTGSVKAVLIL